MAQAQARVSTGADPISAWLAEPAILAEGGPVSAIHWWAQKASEQPPHPLAFMAMDVLSVPGKFLRTMHSHLQQHQLR